MRKKSLLIILFSFIYIFSILSISAIDVKVPTLGSDAAVVIDADSGQILFSKNMDKKEYPASITKILTTYVALKNKKPEDIITMSETAVLSIPSYSSHIALDVGEQLTLNEALYSVMLPSANDASNGVAELVGTTLEGFAKMMNATAMAVGAKNSNFVNAHGLPDENHYTTAYDMALITQSAIKIPEFMQYFGAVLHTMPPTNKQKEERAFPNQHDMLKNTKYKYEGAIGGKVGWTEDAKHTLVTVAKRGTRTLIAVTMKANSNEEKYADTKAILDYGFDKYKQITLTTGTIPKKNVEFTGADDKKSTAYVATKPVANEISLYIPAIATADDIAVEYNFSDKMTNTNVDKFVPTATLKLKDTIKGTYDVLATIPLEFEMLDKNGNAINSSSSTADGSKSKNLFSTTLIIAGVILSMLISFRQINLQKSRNRKLQEMRLKHRRQMQQNRRNLYGEIPFSSIPQNSQTKSHYSKDYVPISNVDPKNLQNNTAKSNIRQKTPQKKNTATDKNRTTKVR